MPSTFSIQSVAVPLLWENYFTSDAPQFTTISTATLLSRMLGMGANDARLLGSYGQLSSVTASTYEPFTTQSLASLRAFTDAAHAAGMTITWAPVSNILGVISGDPSQPSHLSPSDLNGWFQNFSAAVLANAQIAQQIGAERFIFFSDIEQPVFEEHPELADDMVALIAQIRSIFSGVVSSTIFTSDGLLERFPREILAALDTIGLGLVPRLTTSNTASVADLHAGWRSETYGGRDVIDNLVRLVAETGKPIWISDFVASSYDGSNAFSPFKFDFTATFVPDQVEQANYYQAAFDIFRSLQADWFLGLSAQNMGRIEDDHGILPVYIHSAVGEDFYGKLAGTVLTQFFTGQAPPSVIAQYGSDYGEALTGGYALNDFHAGRANQVLTGGRFADRFFSSLPAQATQHTLQLNLSGNPANGTAPTFEIRVNGVVIPVQYSATTPLSGTSGSTITIPLITDVLITSIDFATTNWYISGTDNRLI